MGIPPPPVVGIVIHTHARFMVVSKDFLACVTRGPTWLVLDTHAQQAPHTCIHRNSFVALTCPSNALLPVWNVQALRREASCRPSTVS